MVMLCRLRQEGVTVEVSGTKYVDRSIDSERISALEREGFSSVVARVLAGRGVSTSREVETNLARLLKVKDLKGATDAGELMADAVSSGSRVCIVADYDCDGASACALMLRGLRMLGAHDGTLSYVVPDRKKDGYGLTPEIVDRAIALHTPQIIVTVDNGISRSEEHTSELQSPLKLVCR